MNDKAYFQGTTRDERFADANARMERMIHNDEDSSVGIVLERSTCSVTGANFHPGYGNPYLVITRYVVMDDKDGKPFDTGSHFTMDKNELLSALAFIEGQEATR